LTGISTDMSNSAFVAFGTGPTCGYIILNFLFKFVIVVASTVNNASVSVIIFIMIFFIFQIKINRKLPLVPNIPRL
jgi:hypothetical protein